MHARDTPLELTRCSQQEWFANGTIIPPVAAAPMAANVATSNNIYMYMAI